MALFQLAGHSKVTRLLIVPVNDVLIMAVKPVSFNDDISARAASSLQGHLEPGEGEPARPNPAAVCAMSLQLCLRQDEPLATMHVH